MIIGVPKEIKVRENRVGLVPGGVKQLVQDGHQVIVENNAGLGIGITNDEYIAAGATIMATAAEVFNKAKMIIKVKEPQTPEIEMLRLTSLI